MRIGARIGQRRVCAIGRRHRQATGHRPRRCHGGRTAGPTVAQQARSQTLQAQFDDLTNRIREVFRLQRFERIDGTCGGYVHHNGAVGVLLHVEGGSEELAKDICMHTAAMRPRVLAIADLDPAVVAREREVLSEAARQRRQTGQHHRQNGGRPPAQLLRRAMPGRATLRQRRQAHRRQGRRELPE